MMCWLQVGSQSLVFFLSFLSLCSDIVPYSDHVLTTDLCERVNQLNLFSFRISVRSFINSFS